MIDSKGLVAAFWFCIAVAVLVGGCVTLVGQRACSTYEVRIERKP